MVVVRSLKGQVGGSYDSHSWMVVFSLGMKEGSFHENNVRLSWGFVGNDDDSEVSVEKRSSHFGSGIAFVIGVKILAVSGGLAIVVAPAPVAVIAIATVVAIAVAIIVAVAVVVVLASLIACCTVVAVNVAARIDGRDSIAATSPLSAMATIIPDFVQVLSALRGFSDRHGLWGIVRVIELFELDTGIEQGAGSASKKDGGKYTGGHSHSLMLVCVRRSFKDPVCIEKQVEVVGADYRFLLGQSAEAVQFDQQIHILREVETSA